MSNDQSEVMVKCPGCEHRLPERALREQVAHMKAEHAEIIDRRLEAAGFVRDGKGWLDALADPNG